MLLWWGNGEHFCNVHVAKNQNYWNSITFKGTNFRSENACAPNHKKQYGLAHTKFLKNSGQDVTKKNSAPTGEKVGANLGESKKPLDQWSKTTSRLIKKNEKYDIKIKKSCSGEETGRIFEKKLHT